MSTLSLIGVDPGMVHTGIVSLVLDDETNTHAVSYRVVNGRTAANDQRAPHEVADEIAYCVDRLPSADRVFVEKYRSRANNFSTDGPMRQLEYALRARVNNIELVDNTGVLQVVRRPLMERFNVWSFQTPTHHQDLRSAARILLYGALKDKELNEYIARMLLFNLRHRPD